MSYVGVENEVCLINSCRIHGVGAATKFSHLIPCGRARCYERQNMSKLRYVLSWVVIA